MSESQNNSKSGRLSQEEFRNDALNNIEKLKAFELEKQVYQNDFPIKVFPLILQEIIKASNEFLCFPIDFMSSSILYAASLGIGNSCRIKIKESWIENVALFLVLVGKSGVTKSHPLTFAIEPIFQKDQENFQEFINLLEKYNLLNSYTKKEREDGGMEEPQKPIHKKIILTDSTPEALAEVHNNNRRGIGVFYDEMAGWFKNFNRYNKGSEQEFWLSAWSRKPVIIDRKSGIPLLITNPFISVAGTIQTGLLNEIIKENRDENGFLQRLLFVMPEGLEKQYWNEFDVPRHLTDKYHEIIKKLLDLPFLLNEDGSIISNILSFTPTAKQILIDWQRQNTNECRERDEDSLNAIASKMETYISRFALILQMLRWACGVDSADFVNDEAVRGAIKLAKYFQINAEKVQSLLSNNHPIAKFSKDKKTVFENLPETFKRDIGLTIAENLNMSRATFDRFLKEKDLFLKTANGEYEKQH